MKRAARQMTARWPGARRAAARWARRAVLGGAVLALAALAAAAEPDGTPPTAPTLRPTRTRSRPESAHGRESLRLTRLTAGVLPADGLLTLGLGARTCSTVYRLGDERQRVGRREYFLTAEWSPLPWLQGWAELPWQTWSDGGDWVPVSGGALGDGTWQVAAGLPLAGGALGLAALGGGNLPTGDRGAGLGQGVFSPSLGAAATLRLWRDATVPELRLHLNAARTWNRNEDEGYGWGQSGLEPWPTRYPAAAAVGGPGGNDATTLGAALEFRRGSSALWLEYSRDRFGANDAVSAREQFSGVGAGLRWGLLEGWAVDGRYLVSLARDDTATVWYPSFPDWTMSVAVSRQFGVGGRDRDGDGIVDRRDRCRDQAEDRDGFRDDDGCPDLDNDLDGIIDARDAAPNEPEDHDGYLDLDGAPDLDNDGDGVPDREDLCPNLPEDHDGVADEDGCPDEVRDSDHDGVPDDADLCPLVPEDLDGFGDRDGCPDVDNDLDGIEDARDACPDQPETYNGTADDDGCPDDGGTAGADRR